MVSADDYPNVLVRCVNYLEWDLGLDPIGASDMIHDFVKWFTPKYYQGEFVSPEQMWVLFNKQVVEPVYKISVVAVPEGSDLKNA